MSDFVNEASDSAMNVIDLSHERVVDALAARIGGSVAEYLEGSEIDAAIAEGIDKALDDISEADCNLVVDAVTEAVRDRIVEMAARVAASRLAAAATTCQREAVSTPVA